MTTFTTHRILTLRAQGLTIPEVAKLTGVAEPGVRLCLKRESNRKHRAKHGNPSARACEAREAALGMIRDGYDRRVVEACFGAL